MERRPEDIYYEDEIDLYELWLKIKKRWRLVFSISIIFVTIACIYSFLSKPVYESSFVVKIPEVVTKVVNIQIITPKEVVKYIDILDKLHKEKRYNDLSNILSLDINNVKDIVYITAREIRGTKNAIEVIVGVNNPRLIPTLSKNIVQFLNKNPYVFERILSEKKTLQLQILNIEKRIKALEETRRTINELVKQGKEIHFNPVEIDRTIQELTKQLVETRKQLSLLKGFEMSVEPIIPDKPAKPKKKLIIAIAGVSSLFLGVFLALFLEWLEEVRRRHKEMQN